MHGPMWTYVLRHHLLLRAIYRRSQPLPAATGPRRRGVLGADRRGSAR
jgi:hypothetical protein